MRIPWGGSRTNIRLVGTTPGLQKIMSGPSFIIHLIRHGEVHNPQGILYGRLPRFALSDQGRRQADAAGRHLRHRPLRALFSSPMLRARQTAEAIHRYHLHLNVRITGLINEVCTSYEGCPGNEVDARDGDIYTGAGDDFEQPADLVTRTRKFIARERRRHAGEEVAAVTHGDVVTFMALWAMGVSAVPENKTRLVRAGFPEAYPGHASITTLTYRGGDPERRPTVDYYQP